jgi:hypothetical protein
MIVSRSMNNYSIIYFDSPVVLCASTSVISGSILTIGTRKLKPSLADIAMPGMADMSLCLPTKFS